MKIKLEKIKAKHKFQWLLSWAKKVTDISPESPDIQLLAKKLKENGSVSLFINGKMHRMKLNKE